MKTMLAEVQAVMEITERRAVRLRGCPCILVFLGSEWQVFADKFGII